MSETILFLEYRENFPFKAEINNFVHFVFLFTSENLINSTLTSVKYIVSIGGNLFASL